MTYSDMCAWADFFDLINNRMSILNNILGARYDNCADSPCRIKYRTGRYRCEVCGETFAEFRVYDLDSTKRAFAMVDSLADGLWLLNRSGRLAFT